jgi:hypothetical protein
MRLCIWCAIRYAVAVKGNAMALPRASPILCHATHRKPARHTADLFRTRWKMP